MPDLNIRHVDESLMRELKAKAAVDGYTLRDYTIKALWAAVNGKANIPIHDAGVDKREPAIRPAATEVTEIKETGEMKSKKNPYCRHGLAFCQTCRSLS